MLENLYGWLGAQSDNPLSKGKMFSETQRILQMSTGPYYNNIQN